MKAVLEAAVSTSFQLATMHYKDALRERSTLLSTLMTAEQTARLREVERRDGAVGAAASAAADDDAAIEGDGGDAPAGAGSIQPLFNGLAVRDEDGQPVDESAWSRLFERLQVELSAASGWERFTRAATCAHWGRAGLLQLATAHLTSTSMTHVGIALLPSQLSATAHANSLLHAARLLSHRSTHEAQRLLMAADTRPRDLASFVGAIKAMRDAETEVSAALALPGRLEGLHRLLARFGVAVPLEDTACVDKLRLWASTLREKQEALTRGYAQPMNKYVAEAAAAAAALSSRVDEIVHEAARRGVFKPTAVAEIVVEAAGELASDIESCLSNDVPRVRRWLQILDHPAPMPQLDCIAAVACDVRVSASAWAFLARWRADLETMLDTPLVKLQARDAHFDEELRTNEDALLRLIAQWQRGTAGATTPLAGARPGPARAHGALPGGSPDAQEQEGGAGTRPPAGLVEGSTDQVLGRPDAAEASSCNVVCLQAEAELGVWRAALPLVHTLLHPQMRSAQWQRVLMTVPPPTAAADDDAADDDTVDPVVLAAEEAAREAARRQAADEQQARLRNPCLRILWEHGLQTFASTIKKVLEQTLAASAADAKASRRKARRKAQRQAQSHSDPMTQREAERALHGHGPERARA